MIVSIALCGLLIAVSGDALSGDGFGNVKRLETEFTMTGDETWDTNRRGVATALDKIIKKSSMVYASSLYRVYKRKGGYTQALKDFNSLVPTPTGTNGLTRWGDDAKGKKRVYLQNEFGKPVLSIWQRDKKIGVDTIIDKIEYF